MIMKNNTLKTFTLSAMVLGIFVSTVGCASNTDLAVTEDPGDSISTESVDISNSYDNTEELSAIYPVINPTLIDTEMEKNIQNRLLNGFENWNRGYDAWEAWCEILYTQDSLYNVHGVQLTLKEYQTAMNATLQASDIQMGVFNNMIVCDDWCAIRYDISTTDRQTGETIEGGVMEFVQFKDYGDELGTRVVEGWAGTKGPDFDSLTSLLTEEEKLAQEDALNAILNMQIPDTTDLAVKYPVKYPSSIESDMDKKIQNAILNDFENWNQGNNIWLSWADSYYDSNMLYHIDDASMTLAQYKESVKSSSDTTDITRIYFDNMLISGEWAAIHYRCIEQDVDTGEKTPIEVMQFLHFKEDGDSVKVTECWSL